MRLADDVAEPEPPGPGWHVLRPRLAGICGSDLATLDGHSSRYFEPIVSFPFTPGHEVVGELDDGTRAVLIPVLSCEARGVEPMCPQCREGRINRCERIAFGHLEPGLQTGFCETTGGGWGTRLIAHDSQLVPVPEGLGDEAAVVVEPTACAVHAARVVLERDPVAVAVVGSGALGLLLVAALRYLGSGATIVATAKHPDQRRRVTELGADRVVEPGALERVTRSVTGSWLVGGRPTGGFPVVADCVGSADSITQSLAVAAPGAEVVLVGMPGHVALDLTPVWHRETALRGCYAYDRSDFDAALDLVAGADLGRLVSATYPLDRYRDAVAHAAEAGRRGAVRIAFDLRTERHR
ncbi:MAG: zinc-binding dehydrogenase [Actinobacteria bacterium]|nr:zinc-binding dehydrogenase [Actinomycetota bacterium]